MKTLKTFFILILSLACLSGAQAQSNWEYNQTVSTSASVSVCATGQLSLVIHFDNAPTNLNWQLKDANNTVYAQAPTYGYPSTTAGQTVTETLPALADGDYALVVFDAGGDGLCCNNGNGYYELLDGNNAVIATGANYVYSDITTFCYNVTNNDVFDLQAPTDPVLSISNVNSTGADLNWVASTDNVGVWAYGIIIDGVYADLTFGTSYQIWYLQPSTTYEVTILARDDFGNFSNLSIAISFTTLSNVTTVSQPISASYFEQGWDGWSDGGSDCFRYSGHKAAEGSYAIRLRDNSGSRSSMTSANMDLSSFDSIRVDFQYYHQGYENGEDFFVRLHENGSYTTAATFVRGTDFTSNGFYSGSVLMKATDYSFATNNKIRIQSDASNNNDRIFVDAVVVTGYYQGTSSRPIRRGSNVHSFLTEGPNQKLAKRAVQKSTVAISLYPNPTADRLHIQGLESGFSPDCHIYSSKGEVVLKTKTASEFIDVSFLKTGIYFLTFQDKEGTHRVLQFVKN